MQFLFALRSRGVTDARVLTAMEKIDRAPFIRGYFTGRAYEDMPLPIACGQTISQPSIVGVMSQALDVQPRRQGSRNRYGIGISGRDPVKAGTAGLYSGPVSAARRGCTGSL